MPRPRPPCTPSQFRPGHAAQRQPAGDGRLAGHVLAPQPADLDIRLAPALTTVSALLAACGPAADAGLSPAAATPVPAALNAAAAPAALTERVAYTPEELAAAFAADGSSAVDAAPAARFLAQASFGATVSSLAAVRTQGLAAWLEGQFVVPRGEPHVQRIFAQSDALGGWLYTTPTFGPRNSELMLNEAWRVFITGPDALRQRIVAAWLEIFVITTRVGVIGIGQNQVTAAAYVDMLGAQAFGNFRDLLEAVATSTAMGVYLSHRDNQKAEYGPDGVETRVPDENFARELLQLFSIGLHQLNPDGSLKLKKGQAQDSYTQADVFNLARVFTGWRVTKPVDGEHDMAQWARPMTPHADTHSPEEKAFLGRVIPAGTSARASLKRALDTVFEHANVGPFIGRQLIQRLVTSNPSPAYVARVSAAFDNNGQGVRGDLKAVIRAVLLDAEARSGQPGQGDLANVRGKVREPMMRLVAVARAMEAGDPGELIFPVANLSGASTGIGQSPLRSPSVFNFFRPGYAAPQSELGALGHVAPEFQLLNGPLIAASVNKINEFVRQASQYLPLDLRHWRDLSGRPAALVQRANLMLTGGMLPPADAQAFADAVAQVPARDAGLRVQVALQLVASSAAFVLQTW